VHHKPDSDIKLPPAGKAKTGSDSDVALVPTVSADKGTDSEIPLKFDDDEEEGFSLAASDDDSSTQEIHLGGEDEVGSVLDEEDSGISLASGSSLTLAGESGISLDRPNDSGIALDDDSALHLADSGISLELEADSGITLADVPSEKGNSRAGAGTGAAAKKTDDESDDDFGSTIPTMDSPVADDDDLLDTQMEVPLLSGDDSDFDISAGDDSSASVITLDDEDEVSDASATMVRKRGAEDEDLLDEAFDSGDDFASDDFGTDDDLIGEDDELEELDAFGAADEDFDEGLETGESHAEMPVSMPMRGMAAPIEHDWGTGTFVGLAFSALVMVLCSTVMFDLVRNMWYTDVSRQNPVSSALLDAIRGMFG
jgi:hypothetical protein